MGEVKEAVKGPTRKKVLGKSQGNLVDQYKALLDEVDRLTEIKDDDTLNEGPEEQANNMRKAALLRAVCSLTTACVAMLEDY